MQYVQSVQRHVSIAIVLFLVLVAFVPLLGGVSAGHGGDVQSYLGGGPFFGEPAAAGPDPVEVELFVPFFQNPTPPLDEPGYSGVLLTIPTEWVPAGLDKADLVTGVAFCPTASNSWQPIRHACQPLEPSAGADPESGKYTVTEDGNDVKVEPGEDGHQIPLRITLLVQPPATVPADGSTAEKIGMVFYGTDWNADSPHNLDASIALPVAEADSIRIVFAAAGGQELDAAEFPQVMTTDETYGFYARAMAGETPLSRIQATWDTVGGGAGCGDFEPRVGIRTTFEPMRTANPDDDCTIEATGGGAVGESSALRILPGNPERFVVIVDEDDEAVDTRTYTAGEEETFRLNMHDAKSNTFLGLGVAAWHVDGGCGEPMPAVGPMTTIQFTTVPDDHCHIHAELLEDPRLEHETGHILVVPTDPFSITIQGPATVQAGQETSYTAVVEDAFGNVLVDEAVEWEAIGATLDPALGSSTDFTATDVGSYALNATHPADDAVNATIDIDIEAGSTSGLRWVTAPQGFTADGSTSFEAETIDDHGNPTGDAVSYTVDGEASGSSFTETTADDYEICAVAAGAPDHCETITVSPDAATQMEWVDEPVDFSAGDTITFEAQTVDQYRNPTGDAVTYEVERQAATSSFSTTDAGTYEICALATDLEDLCETIEVVAAATSGLRWDTRPENFTAGGSTNFEAETIDEFGNPTGDAVSYTVDGEASGPSFSETTADDYVICARAAGAPNRCETIAVSAAAADHLEWVSQPADFTAGGETPFEARAVDEYENPTSDEVSYTVDDEAATSSFSTTDAGTYKICALATDLEDLCETIEVGPAATAWLRWVTAPEDFTAGGSTSFEAETIDHHGNPTGDAVSYTVDGVSSGPSFSETSADGYVICAVAAGAPNQCETITVSAAGADHLVWGTEPAGFAAGGETLFEAETVDTHGNPTGDPVSYTVEGQATTSSFSTTDAGTYKICALATGLADLCETIEVVAAATSGLRWVAAPEGFTAGDSTSFEAETLDHHGNPTGDAVSYTVDGEASGSSFFETTTDDYVVCAVAAGAPNRCETITVSAAAADHLEWVSQPADFAAGGETLFEARAVDEYENPTSDEVSYTVDDEAATSSFSTTDAGTYEICALATDLAEICATITVNAATATTLEWVTEPGDFTAGDSTTFEARTLDAHGNPTGDPVSYTVDGEAATSPFTSSTADDYTICALATDLADLCATITVSPGPVDHLTIQDSGGATIGALVVPVGDDVPLFAAHYDEHGNFIDLAPAFWGRTGDLESSSPGSGSSTTFSPTKAGTEGRITAFDDVGNFDATGTVTVVAGPLDRIDLTGGDASVAAGASTDFTATGFDAHDNIVEITPDWDVVEVNCGTAMDGTFTGPETADQTCTVKASVDSVAGTAAVDIVPAALSEIEVVCDDATITVDASTSCTATPMDSFGNARDDVPDWSATGGTYSTSSGATTTYTAPAASGTETLTASVGDTTGTFEVTVDPGALASIVFAHTDGAPAVEIDADDATTTVEATANDGNGNVIPGLTIHWTLEEGLGNALSGGALSSGSSTTDANGVATVTLTTATLSGESYHVVAGDDPDAPGVTATSGVWTVVPGAFSALEVACTSGCNPQTGDAVDFEVTLLDGHGNVLDAGSNAVNADDPVVFSGASDAPDETRPTCTDKDAVATELGLGTTLSFTDGVGSTSCVFTTSETVVLGATIGGVSADAGEVTVAVGDLDHVAFEDPAGSTDADSPIDLTAVPKDAFGNLRMDAVTCAVHDGPDGDTSAIDSDCTNFVPDKTGSVTIRATSGGSVIADHILTVTPGALAAFDLTVPASTTAGDALTVTVTARDGNGNLKTDYLGTVAFTSSDSEADLPEPYTFEEGDDGVASVSVTLYTSALPSRTQTVTAEDAVAAVSATSDPIAVDPSVLDHFVIDPILSETVAVGAGSVNEVKVTAYDEFGNLLKEGTTVYWFLSSGATNAGSGSLSHHESTTDASGATTVDLTVSSDDGDFFRVRAADDPDYDLAQVKTTSGRFDVTVA